MADEYVHGYADEEQERLLAQAEHWRDELILPGTDLPPGTRLLEVGCGVGAVLGILGEAFPGIELAGVDLEERQLETARLHLAGLGLDADLRRADALALPFDDGSFDHVWMMWFLEHVPDPVAVLQEARRVLAVGGGLTAIEVDYDTVWASPTTESFQAVFAAVAATMANSGRSDAGSLVAGWLEEAGFEGVDPGERRLAYSGEALARQVPYVVSVVESTVPGLEQGLADLRELASGPGSSMGWVIHKATARR
jgi:ubiquinone/menaquinone biosynthesis C-methylase UbiE